MSDKKQTPTPLYKNSSHLDFTFCSLLAFCSCLPCQGFENVLIVLCCVSGAELVLADVVTTTTLVHQDDLCRNGFFKLISKAFSPKGFDDMGTQTRVFVPLSRFSFAGNGWGPAWRWTDLLWSGSSDRSSTERRWQRREYWAACLWFHAGTKELSLLLYLVFDGSL